MNISFIFIFSKYNLRFFNTLVLELILENVIDTMILQKVISSSFFQLSNLDFKLREKSTILFHIIIIIMRIHLTCQMQ
ncbi:hypothetical protein DERP_005813 [Dermatophagoides pteronyssinus]|uniref:Uncharacterized protein n=1 Tax=Dermatophagoides pteronyssinus TaxID=6956 RepID=A0ABQ8JAC1_DERPT|nr:hypothetical protein DERP_005813 [Dermatophagoides pteronyssinus]